MRHSKVPVPWRGVNSARPNRREARLGGQWLVARKCPPDPMPGFSSTLPASGSPRRSSTWEASASVLLSPALALLLRRWLGEVELPHPVATCLGTLKQWDTRALASARSLETHAFTADISTCIVDHCAGCVSSAASGRGFIVLDEVVQGPAVTRHGNEIVERVRSSRAGRRTRVAPFRRPKKFGRPAWLPRRLHDSFIRGWGSSRRALCACTAGASAMSGEASGPEEEIIGPAVNTVIEGNTAGRQPPTETGGPSCCQPRNRGVGIPLVLPQGSDQQGRGPMPTIHEPRGLSNTRSLCLKRARREQNDSEKRP